MEDRMSAEVISLLSFARSKALGKPADAVIDQRELVGHVAGDYFVWFEHQVRRYMRLELRQIDELRPITKTWRHGGARCRHCAEYGLDMGMDDAGEVLHVHCPHCGVIERLAISARYVKVLGAQDVRCVQCGTITRSRFAICNHCRDHVYKPAGQWCGDHGPTLGSCLVCDSTDSNPKGAA